MFPEAFLGKEKALSFLEKLLNFDSSNIFELAVINWHLLLGYKKFHSSNVGKDSSYVLHSGANVYPLLDIYNAALNGINSLDEYNRIIKK